MCLWLVLVAIRIKVQDNKQQVKVNSILKWQLGIANLYVAKGSPDQQAHGRTVEGKAPGVYARLKFLVVGLN